jgi:hypothetical protein
MSNLLHWNWFGETRFPGNSAKQIAAGQNADGRLEIFYVGGDNQLFRNWQTSPNGSWAGETRFPGNSAKQIAVGQNADGRLEIFYVGGDNQLFHNWQTSPNGSWAGETRFPGNSAKQIAVGQNADGRIEIFYVGGDNQLFHNWQTSPNGGWASETRFPGNSATQIAVERNADGRLEIFYVGTNGDLYHNWQSTRDGPWAEEVRFPNNSAKSVAVGQNKDGRLEIFYVGGDNQLFHNWQVTPNAGWVNHNGGQPAPLPLWGIGSNSNYLLSSGCGNLADVSVTIDVIEDIVCSSNSPNQDPEACPGGPFVHGFSWQLNCNSPMQETDSFQQYVIGFDNQKIYGQINNWKTTSSQLINQSYDLTSPPGGKIPRGYQLGIELYNDADGNITGVHFTVVDNNGNKVGANIVTLTSISGLTARDLAPIVAFQINLVGPGNSEGALLSSGAGSITYLASSPFSVMDSEPLPCVEAVSTCETANSLYSAMSRGPSNFLTQTFSTTQPDALKIRPGRKIRPPLILPANHRQLDIVR